jgi:hypothetical protein
MSQRKIKKDEVKALIDLIFKPFEFIIASAEASAKTQEDHLKVENAKKIVELLKETLQDIAILALEE